MGDSLTRGDCHDQTEAKHGPGRSEERFDKEDHGDRDEHGARPGGRPRTNTIIIIHEHRFSQGINYRVRMWLTGTIARRILTSRP